MANDSTTIAPNGLRSFTVKHVKPESQDVIVQCTLGIQLLDGKAQFLLIRDTLPDDSYEPALWARLSSIVSSRPLKNPDDQGRYAFYMKTYSENEGVLEQLVAAGIVEQDPSPPVHQGFVTFPLVYVKIPLKELAKQCGRCERWELCDDEKRMRACSRCKEESKTWYCDENCQKEHWKIGYPAHKKVCGK